MNAVGSIDHGLHLASRIETDLMTSEHTVNMAQSHAVEIHHDGKDLDIPNAKDIKDGESYNRDVEPYMMTGYQGLENFQGTQIVQSPAHAPHVNLYGGSGLSNEPASGQPYASFRDPIYNTRSWWEHTGDRSAERQYGLF